MPYSGVSQWWHQHNGEVVLFVWPAEAMSKMGVLPKNALAFVGAMNEVEFSSLKGGDLTVMKLRPGDSAWIPMAHEIVMVSLTDTSNTLVVPWLNVKFVSMSSSSAVEYAMARLSWVANDPKCEFAGQPLEDVLRWMASARKASSEYEAPTKALCDVDQDKAQDDKSQITAETDNKQTEAETQAMGETQEETADGDAKDASKGEVQGDSTKKEPSDLDDHPVIGSEGK